MNIKKLKTIRKLCRAFNLSYTYWKNRYEDMDEKERKEFLTDAETNLLIEWRRKRRLELQKLHSKWKKTE